jgi:hypothetical protein
MSRFTLVFMLCIFLLSGSLPAQAAPAEMKYLFYDHFTMQVPKDWTAEKNKKAVTIANADKSTTLVIQTIDPFNQASSRDFAESLRSSGNGTELKDNGDGLFSFTTEKDGKTWRSLAGVINSSAVFIFSSGNDPSLEAALKTLQLKVVFIPNVSALSQ